MNNPNDIVPQKLTEEEKLEVEELVRPRAAMLYEVVRQEGERELVRTAGALWWSGIAAGLSLGLSVLVMATLKTLVPEDSLGGALIAPLGYTVGFLIVVLARQQLFTENTITAVLPLMVDKTWINFYRTARLWLIVLIANLIGTFTFTIFIAYSGGVSEEVLVAARGIASHMMDKSSTEMFFGAVVAGWLIASMVWAVPSAEGMAFWVILLITYVIALLEASHIIAGSVEAYLLVLNGEVTAAYALRHFGLLTLMGNIVGGTTLFAMIAYVQVREEVNETRPSDH